MDFSVSNKGAELVSLKKGGWEYLWQADPMVWGRHAPILFPLVGKAFENKFVIDGTTFHLGQHGFARDLEFVASDSNSELLKRFELNASEQTLQSFPYNFQLQVEYELRGNTLVKKDTVCNFDTQTMYFHIGNHPGFRYRDFCVEDEVHGYMKFYNGGKEVTRLLASRLSKQGYVVDGYLPFLLAEGLLPLTDALFQNDALVFEDMQVSRAILLDKQRNPYLEVSFSQAEVLGVWSPVGKSAPFVCIEPWNGRADAEGYSGEFQNRKWTQQLGPSAQKTYTIEITCL